MKYLKINVTALVVSSIYMLLLYTLLGQDLLKSVMWGIGIFSLTWCAYVDTRVQLAPDKFLVPLCLVPIVFSLLQAYNVGIETAAEVLIGMSLSAGTIWVFRIVASWVFQKEALGEADIFPCAFVGGMAGPIQGIMTFLLTPFVMLPIILFILIRTRRMPTRLPLLPALLITTLISNPIFLCLQNYLLIHQ